MKKTVNRLSRIMTRAVPAFLILFTIHSCSTRSPQEAKGMVVWYNKPAGNAWLDGLFIGNGYMGANVFGRVEN